VTNLTATCEVCDLNMRLGRGAICDGSGILVISDIPTSRVPVCPAWPVDEDEPLAYFQAVEGWDPMPATMQQRIRDNAIAEMEREYRHAPYLDEPADDPERIPMIVTLFVLVLLMLAVLAGILYPWGGLA